MGFGQETKRYVMVINGRRQIQAEDGGTYKHRTGRAVPLRPRIGFYVKELRTGKINAVLSLLPKKVTSPCRKNCRRKNGMNPVLALTGRRRCKYKLEGINFEKRKGQTG
jgi:hypothetical protein